MNKLLNELLIRIDIIKDIILTDIENLRPREINNHAIELSSINDTLSSLLSSAEKTYAEFWIKVRKQIKSISELVNALKKRGSLLEAEVRNKI